MKRREVLFISLPLFSGCVGRETRNFEQEYEATRVPLGKRVAHNGWQLAITDWTTANEYRDSFNNDIHRTGDDTIYIFAEGFVQNVSDRARYDPPSNLTFKPVNVGEPAVTISATAPFEYYLLDGGKRYRTYQYAFSEIHNRRDPGVSPGEIITGWQVYRIPADYNRDNLEFRAGFGMSEYFWYVD